VWRKDVDTVLDEGLGRFLQKVALEPEVQQGAFIGFRVVELRPPSWWQGVDIKAGDVVTLVNGMPIEQPTEAHAAFESLRKSDKLTVKYLRGSETRELSFSILDKPTAPGTPAAPAKPAS
jgi:S1-C subfamily serine protease